MTAKRSATLLLLTLSLLLLTALATAAFARPTGPALNLSLQTFVPPGALEAPVEIAHAGDARLFVVEREGRIRIVRPNGYVEPTPFLDIADRVRLIPGTEQGLLGLAFHPDYAGNGAFYVNYIAEFDGATRVSRFTVSANPDVADRDSEVLILHVPQAQAMHYGGDLLFGPDGYLYIGFGDGLGGNDNQNRVQNLQKLHGKLLRIDVNATAGTLPDCGATSAPPAYRIPRDNPFHDGSGGACDEIWALGLRNPWRLSFDRQTGDLFIGDVGEAAWEEINVQSASSTGGENYGWPCYEGMHYNDENQMPACEDASAYDMPVVEYSHDDGNCSVTGGYVYRGYRFPEMDGRYLHSDFCNPYVWDLYNNGGVWESTRHDNARALPGGVATLGEDVYGELFIASMYDGGVYRIVEDTLITDVDPQFFLPTFFSGMP